MARIYRFPQAARRHSVPPPPVVVVIDQPSWFKAGGFVLLWAASFVAVILYFSGLAGISRDDRFYAALLIAVWGFYFLHPPLLKLRVLGSLLRLVGHLSMLAGVVGFFGGVYWLIWSPSS